MEDKKIKEFIKIYLDTIQHSKNIKKWIEASSRKKGDLNKSMERLENKYSKLLVLKEQLESNGTSIESILKKASRNNSIDDYKTLLKNIKELYTLTKTAIPNKLVQEERKVNAPKLRVVNAKRQIDYTGDIENERIKDYQNEYIYYSGYYERPPLLYRFKMAMKNFAEKSKNFFARSKKAIIKTVSVALVSAIALAGGISAGESNSETAKTDNNSVSYGTTSKDIKPENSAIETAYTEFTSPSQATPDSVSQDEKVSIAKESKENETKKETQYQQNQQKKPIDQNINEFCVGNGDYFIKANTRYTEVSDGSGNWGEFSEDTVVRVYNRALVRTDTNGNKQILETTRVGQTWEEFAQENDMDYNDFKNYVEKNNIEKCVSLESSDGIHSYGWVSESALEKLPEKDIDLTR